MMCELRDIPLFQGFSTKERQMLQSYLREEHFEKRQLLCIEGQSCIRILIILSGRIKIFRTSLDGKKQILEILEPGDTCVCNPGDGAWSCFASAQTLTPCHVLILPRQQYLRLLKTHSRLPHTINQILARRLSRLSSLVEEVTLNNPQKRLVKFICDASVQPSCASAGTPCVCHLLTHEEISQRLGLARETVTRHLQRLKQLGFIEIQPHRIIVRDKEGLERILTE